MKSWVIDYYCASFIQESYNRFSNFSYSKKKDSLYNPQAYWLIAPLALCEVTVEALKPALKAIEALALMVINLLGTLFCVEDCSLRDVLHNMGKMLSNIVVMPVGLIFAPIDFIYQLLQIIQEPRLGNSYDVLALHTATATHLYGRNYPEYWNIAVTLA